MPTLRFPRFPGLARVAISYHWTTLLPVPELLGIGGMGRFPNFERVNSGKDLESIESSFIIARAGLHPTVRSKVDGSAPPLRRPLNHTTKCRFGPNVLNRC